MLAASESLLKFNNVIAASINSCISVISFMLDLMASSDLFSNCFIDASIFLFISSDSSYVFRKY